MKAVGVEGGHPVNPVSGFGEGACKDNFCGFSVLYSVVCLYNVFLVDVFF